MSIVETKRKCCVCHEDIILEKETPVYVEKTKVPYVIIMGKKEFLEGSVMIRENTTRTQQSIPVHKLAEHMKKS